MTMTMTSEAITHIAAQTLAHYERHADEFWRGTHDHDVSQNIAALLHYIEVPPPFELLDFGCGPGRDLKTFKEFNHNPTGLEGAERLATMARATAAAKCCSRISSNSICRPRTSTACSPTPCCSMFPARPCRGY